MPSARCAASSAAALERLLEAMHIDQHVRAAAALPQEIADLCRYRLDRIETPIAQSGCGERETAFVWRHQLRPGDGHPCRALRPEPGFRPPAVHRLARGRDQQRRLHRERRSVVTRTGRSNARAAAERKHAGRRHNPAQQRAAGRNSLVLRQMSDHAQDLREYGLSRKALPQVS